jgi:hypothetical protein
MECEKHKYRRITIGVKTNGHKKKGQVSWTISIFGSRPPKSKLGEERALFFFFCLNQEDENTNIGESLPE